MTNYHVLKMRAADGKMRKTAVAKVARKELEAKTGKKVVSSLTAKDALGEKDAKKLKDNGQ